MLDHREFKPYAVLATLTIAASLSIGGCVDGSAPVDDGADYRPVPSFLAPPPRVAGLRVIDRSVLFAEVTLRYAGSEETVVAQPARDGARWTVDLRVPGGTPYSLEVTWYDTLDGRRLDLVRAEHAFDPTFDSGPITLDFSDYDFDGYDEDLDGETNLAEREAGTSPIGATSIGCPVIPEAQSNVTGEAELFYTDTLDLVDDFESGLPAYSLNRFRLSGQDDGISATDQGARLRVTSDDFDGSGIEIGTVEDTSDSVTARIRFSNESTEIDSASDNDVRVELQGVFFSTRDPDEPLATDDDPRTGEADIRFALRNYLPGGFSRILLCASVRNADGSRSDFVPGTEDGDGDGCAGAAPPFDSFENDREYVIGIGVDRDAKLVRFRIDDQTLEYPFDADVFPAIEPRHELRVGARGPGNLALVDLFEFATEDAGPLAIGDVGAFDTYLLDDNRSIANDPSKERSVDDGRLRLVSIGRQANESVFNGLTINGNTDYLEADLTLSSESELLGEGSSATVRLSGVQYNDITNGGFNGNEGDNRATLELTTGRGRVVGQACLIRFQAADSNACRVFQNPVAFCRPFSSELAFDTAYKASLDFDRDNKLLTYTLDGEQITHLVTTNAYLPASNAKLVDTRMIGAGQAVGFVDNLRTTPSAP